MLFEEEGPDSTRHVAAVGRVLDLDHLRALVGEEQGAEGTCAVLLDAQYPDALKRQHAGSNRE